MASLKTIFIKPILSFFSFIKSKTYVVYCNYLPLRKYVLHSGCSIYRYVYMCLYIYLYCTPSGALIRFVWSITCRLVIAKILILPCDASIWADLAYSAPIPQQHKTFFTVFPNGYLPHVVEPLDWVTLRPVRKWFYGVSAKEDLFSPMACAMGDVTITPLLKAQISPRFIYKPLVPPGFSLGAAEPVVQPTISGIISDPRLTVHSSPEALQLGLFTDRTPKLEKPLHETRFPMSYTQVLHKVPLVRYMHLDFGYTPTEGLPFLSLEDVPEPFPRLPAGMTAPLPCVYIKIGDAIIPEFFFAEQLGKQLRKIVNLNPSDMDATALLQNVIRQIHGAKDMLCVKTLHHPVRLTHPIYEQHQNDYTICTSYYFDNHGDAHFFFKQDGLHKVVNSIFDLSVGPRKGCVSTTWASYCSWFIARSAELAVSTNQGVYGFFVSKVRMDLLKYLSEHSLEPRSEGMSFLDWYSMGRYHSGVFPYTTPLHRDQVWLFHTSTSMLHSSTQSSHTVPLLQGSMPSSTQGTVAGSSNQSGSTNTAPLYVSDLVARSGGFGSVPADKLFIPEEHQSGQQGLSSQSSIDGAFNIDFDAVYESVGFKDRDIRYKKLLEDIDRKAAETPYVYLAGQRYQKHIVDNDASSISSSSGEASSSCEETYDEIEPMNEDELESVQLSMREYASAISAKECTKHSAEDNSNSTTLPSHENPTKGINFKYYLKPVSSAELTDKYQNAQFCSAQHSELTVPTDYTVETVNSNIKSSGQLLTPEQYKEYIREFYSRDLDQDEPASSTAQDRVGYVASSEFPDLNLGTTAVQGSESGATVATGQINIPALNLALRAALRPENEVSYFSRDGSAIHDGNHTYDLNEEAIPRPPGSSPKWKPNNFLFRNKGAETANKGVMSIIKSNSSTILPAGLFLGTVAAVVVAITLF